MGKYNIHTLDGLQASFCSNAWVVIKNFLPPANKT